MTKDADVIVAGAGIVGTACALWAALSGARVLMVDPNPPGSGTSYGNAGTIATYGCLPVNDPGLFTALPRLLFGRNSPLSVSPGHVLRNPRWMLTFLRNCRRTRVDHISEALAALLARADAGLDPLIAAADAEDLFVARGQMTVWSTKTAWQAAQDGLNRRRSLGVAWEALSAERMREMEPGLRLPLAGGVWFPQARHVTDPQALSQRFADTLVARGGLIVAQSVEHVTAKSDEVQVTLADGQVLKAGHLVLSAGAHATTIQGTGVEHLPLGVERGYHLQIAGQGERVTRPVGWAEGGFYATPMSAGLRLAGTVEIAARDAPPNARRLAYLERRAREMFGALEGPRETWLGQRPTLPDSLPALGPAPGKERVLLAFGHQHLGLTLAGATGQITADLVQGRAPNMDLSPFGAARFSRAGMSS